MPSYPGEGKGSFVKTEKEKSCGVQEIYSRRVVDAADGLVMSLRLPCSYILGCKRLLLSCNAYILWLYLHESLPGCQIMSVYKSPEFTDQPSLICDPAQWTQRVTRPNAVGDRLHGAPPPKYCIT